MNVVLFSYVMRDGADARAEADATDRMWSIVSEMPGFISYKSYTAEDGETIAVVRFESRGALDAWKYQPDHRATQDRAREEWFEEYWVQASETFREYRFTRTDGYQQPIPTEVFLKGARPVSRPETQANAASEE
jgi:heme-degrading monooxygenase HmoA